MYVVQCLFTISCVYLAHIACLPVKAVDGGIEALRRPADEPVYSLTYGYGAPRASESWGRPATHYLNEAGVYWISDTAVPPLTTDFEHLGRHRPLRFA